MQAASRSSAREESLLRNLAVAAGLGWSLAFVIVALVYELQLYADGAMFSYAVAVQDVWAFHWHNIAQPHLSVFPFALGPPKPCRTDRTVLRPALSLTVFFSMSRH